MTHTPASELQRIDTAFERLNDLLDASGSLESESIQEATYELRLAICAAIGDPDRIEAAKEALQGLGAPE
jgi:hypothetical protein